MKNLNIEKLLQNAESVENQALKNAIEKHRQEQQEHDVKKVMVVLRIYQNNIDSIVNNVRNIRKTEKALLEQLEKLNEAMAQFEKNNPEELLKLLGLNWDNIRS